MKYFQKKMPSILAGLFILFFITSGLLVAPRPTHAIFPTFDAATFTRTIIENTLSSAAKALTNKEILKEYVLDGAAWLLSKKGLKDITYNTLNDIARGHKNKDGTSGPGFITNLKRYMLKTVGDTTAKTSIKQIQSNKQPGASSYAKTLAKSAGTSARKNYDKGTAQTGFWSTHKETLSKVTTNVKSFLSGDFSSGGWSGWNSIDSNINNNTYHVNNSAKNSTQKKVAKAQANKKTELNWGQGFLSNTKCAGDACSIQTPGSVIKTQLNTVLGSSVASLVSADEFNEVLGTLAQKLSTNIISGGSGGGLADVTNAAAGGGSSMLKKYITEPPPKNTMNNLAASIKNQVAQEEKPIGIYIGNEQKIADAGTSALNNLQKLILYRINYTGSDGNKYSCSTPGPTVIAAQNASNNVQQNVLSPTQKSITDANTGLAKLKKIGAQAPSADAGSLQKITIQLQQLTGQSSELPSLQAMETAKTESVINPKIVTAREPVKSSGVAGLTVTGGTVVGRMDLLSKNATDALGQAQQTCSIQKQQDQDQSNF